MELESKKGALADVDLDAMFKSTSVDEFMRGLSRRGTFAADTAMPTQKSKADAMTLLSDIMSGKSIEDSTQADGRQAPTLEFEREVSTDSAIGLVQDSQALRNKAM